jgi:hypothetical protein
MRKVAEINMSNLQAVLSGVLTRQEDALRPISILESILRQVTTDRGFMMINSSFYTGDLAKPISGGLEAWIGYHASVRISEAGITLNLDTSVTAFYQSAPLMELLCRTLDVRNPHDLERALSSRQAQKQLKCLKGVRVQTEHMADRVAIYSIDRFGTVPASRQMFTMGDSGREISVVDYFRQRYNKILRYPQLPCVITSRNAAIPIELCTVVPKQRAKRQPDERALADLIKIAASRPDRRRNDTNTAHQKLQLDRSQLISTYGINVDTNMMQLKARVLEPPTVMLHPSCRPQATLKPRDGNWSLAGKRLFSCATLASWSIVILSDRRSVSENMTKNFFSFMINEFSGKGLNVTARNPPIIYANPHENLESVLRTAAMLAGKQYNIQPQIVFVVYTNRSEAYSKIKRAAETKVGIMTQGMLSRHMQRPNPQYCANIALKVNKKLGGTSFKLAENMLPYVTEVPTMVLGADVSHPTRLPRGEGFSIPAITASLDPMLSEWDMTYRKQSANVEMIADMQPMVKEMLQSFERRNQGRLPQRLLFYRDGVSDGQFAQAVQEEVTAIKNACREVAPNYDPKLTYVVVKKRHHTRLYAADPRQTDRSGNCQSGTVVDSDITMPGMFDFFLQSQAGIQGTCKAAHYVVLYDEYGFQPDELQAQTYNMCHIYARCTRTVGIVPAVYYAHLMADRAQHYNSARDDSSDTASVVSTTSGLEYDPIMPNLRGRFIIA